MLSEGFEMPPDSQVLIYWDADVFLSYINGMVDRLPHLDSFLAKSGKDIQIVTSTISVVEVAFAKAEQDGQALDAVIEQKINLLWIPQTSPVKLIEFHQQIATGAKDLMRYAISQGWKLKPMDAIHMASAKSIGAGEIHTYETAWDKYSAHLGIKICRPIASDPKLPL
jgi:predicted nucleic acid-binding protein